MEKYVRNVFFYFIPPLRGERFVIRDTSEIRLVGVGGRFQISGFMSDYHLIFLISGEMPWLLSSEF